MREHGLEMRFDTAANGFPDPTKASSALRFMFLMNTYGIYNINETGLAKAQRAAEAFGIDRTLVSRLLDAYEEAGVRTTIRAFPQGVRAPMQDAPVQEQHDSAFPLDSWLEHLRMKSEAITRLRGGEAVDIVARELGVNPLTVVEWRDEVPDFPPDRRRAVAERLHWAALMTENGLPEAFAKAAKQFANPGLAEQALSAMFAVDSIIPSRGSPSFPTRIAVWPWASSIARGLGVDDPTFTLKVSEAYMTALRVTDSLLPTERTPGFTSTIDNEALERLPDAGGSNGRRVAATKGEMDGDETVGDFGP
jgi:hypothetical protein